MTLVQIPKRELLEIPDNTQKTITLENVKNNLLILVGENSSFNILEKNPRKSFVEVFVKRNSKVNYELFSNVACSDVIVRRAIVSRDSSMNWFTALFDSNKIEVTTELAEEGSETRNYGIFLGKKEKKFEIFNNSIHSAPNTFSDMTSKGVLNDESKSVFNGLIHIRKNARSSNGYQKHDALLLSEKAEAKADPNLEIDNNDVRCSHGATIGQIDKEKIFYLMSRGLSRKEAENEIVNGFLGSMINSVSLKFKKMIEEQL